MFRYAFCLIIFLGSAAASVAQSVQDTLLVVPGKKNLYFYHVVTKGETLYGVARKYHLQPQSVADANKITTQTSLKLFQLLKIPLDQNNFVQSGNASVAQLTPLYHKVIEGETLYRVSQMHDKVDPDLLKKWNHLKSNNVKNGEYLVVGWLKADNGNNANTSFENNIQAKPVAQKEVAEPDQGIVKNETVAERNTPATGITPEQTATTSSTTDNTGGGSFLNEVIAAENRNRGGSASITTPSSVHQPVAKQKEIQGQTTPAAADNTTTTNVPSASTKAETTFSQPKPDPAPIEEKTIAEVIPAKENKPTEKKQVEEENPFSKMLNKVTHKPETSVPEPVVADHSKASESSDVAITADAMQTVPEVSSNPASPSSTSAISSVSKSDSLQLAPSVKSEFEQQFDNQTDNGKQIDSKKGAAGWFRSNVKSGSGRYYALCNELPRGSIVKVINPISGKYVLAKVLDAIPKQKENYNLIIKLSDAAMEDLGTSQSRFWCEIRYAKGK